MGRHFRKAVLLVVDGLGDLPVPALDGKTPLEAAHTPHFDRMAALGGYGLADPVARGEVPNTDSGVGLLLGLDPAQTGELRRGPVEAAGAGRILREGEIAVRANFATLEPRAGGLLVRDRRAGRISEGTEELAALLDAMDLGAGATASFRSTDQHRGVLVLSGPALDPAISDTDPGDRTQAALLQTCVALRPQARESARCINAFVAEAHRRLAEHPVNRERMAAGMPPANGVITRGAGAWFEPVNVLAKRGIRAVTVAGCTTVIGLSRILGWETLKRPSFTASVDTDLDGKVRVAKEALADHDLVFIHVKGPDICAHDRQPEAKRDFLQRLDAALAPLIDSGAIVAVSSDHTTDSNTGAHTADPVPVLIYDPAVEGSASVPEGLNFSERACRSGNLARTPGTGFLQRVLDRLTGA